LYLTEPSTPKDDFSCKPARLIGREESSDQADVFWHAGATERRDGLDCCGNLLVSGAMSSWLIFSTFGIFPIAGQDVYLFSTPSIPDASLTLGNGKKLRVVAKNLDPNGLNRYVQSATLSGVDLPNAWFYHAQIKDGAALVLTMGLLLLSGERQLHRRR
jgi:Glycosyl hydrolase family 92